MTNHAEKLAGHVVAERDRELRRRIGELEQWERDQDVYRKSLREEGYDQATNDAARFLREHGEDDNYMSSFTALDGTVIAEVDVKKLAEGLGAGAHRPKGSTVPAAEDVGGFRGVILAGGPTDSEDERRIPRRSGSTES